MSEPKDLLGILVDRFQETPIRHVFCISCKQLITIDASTMEHILGDLSRLQHPEKTRSDLSLAPREDPLTAELRICKGPFRSRGSQE